MSRRKEEKEERYTLTPWGCLYATLLEYDIHLTHDNGKEISGSVGTHIVEDFMDAMVRCGYVGKAKEHDNAEQ